MLRYNGPLTIILLTFSLSGLAQTFEGKVTYTLEIKNADPYLPDSIFNMMYSGEFKVAPPSVTNVYYYRDNNYKSITEGPIKSIQIYEPSTNRSYGYTDGADVAFWSDLNTILTIEKLDVKEEIMGIPCSSIFLKTSNSEVTFYYSAKYKIDISKFKEDNYWEKYLKLSGAIPLKYIIKGGPAKHFVVMTATDVKEEKLTDEFFKVPNFKQTMKSPF